MWRFVQHDCRWRHVSFSLLVTQITHREDVMFEYMFFLAITHALFVSFLD